MTHLMVAVIGMVIRPDIVYDAFQSVWEEQAKVIFLSPQGKTLTQKKVIDLSKEKHLILICGHYEGIDERVIEEIQPEEISIGDYVLTGGELPAMVVTDSIVRLLPGVIKEDSYESDSFTENLLDYPTYTKPADFRGKKVPEVLLSGNHQKIKEWREQQALENTKKRRPDLLGE